MGRRHHDGRNSEGNGKEMDKSKLSKLKYHLPKGRMNIQKLELWNLKL